MTPDELERRARSRTGRASWTSRPRSTTRSLAAGLPEVAPYAVAMAYRVRFYMELNAREAMHMIELRTAPQGHPAYRRICQAMHRLIAEQAGHRAIAAAMSYADLSDAEDGRLARSGRPSRGEAPASFRRW